MYYKQLNINGTDYPIAVNITGAGAPTASTEAAVGMFYMDTTTGDVYKCTAASDGAYTWASVGGSNVELSPTLEGNEEDKAPSVKAVKDGLGKKFDKAQIMQETGDSESEVMSQKAVTKEFKNFYELRGKNLIDPLSITHGMLLYNGIILSNDSYANYHTSDFIPINGETHVVSLVRMETVPVYAARIVTLLYDAERQPIEGGYVSEAATSRVIANADAMYLRVSVMSPYFDGQEGHKVRVQVEKGETPTFWEGFAERYLCEKIDAKNIVPSVKNEVQNTLFLEDKNLFQNAELLGECYSDNGYVSPADAYNVLRVVLPAGNYAVAPRSRFVSNYTAATNFSSVGVDGEVTFSLTERSVIDITVFKADTASMVLYNADLYSREEVEKLGTHTLDTEKIIFPPSVVQSNILYGKKYVACGDSFTAGGYAGDEGIAESEYKFQDGEYTGRQITYPYILGLRNNMTVVNLAVGGMTMCNIDGNRSNSFSNGKYLNIPTDADYITLKFGINDQNFNSPLGTIDDESPATFYGAYNTVLRHILTNCPFAKIGIIVTNGCSDNKTYTDATLAIAKKWGVAYIDEVNDPTVPLLHRVSREGLSAEARQMRLEAFRVSETNTHPNTKAQYYEAAFIENWLRSL